MKNMKEVVKFKGVMFVIPNKATAINSNDFWVIDPVESMSHICRLNGTIFNPHDRLVQVWIAGTTMEDVTDNLLCHGIEGHHNINCCYIPYSLIGNCMEGDTISITFPINNSDAIIECELTCDQINHRYAYIGRFEEALKHVCI